MTNWPVYSGSLFFSGLGLRVSIRPLIFSVSSFSIRKLVKIQKELSEYLGLLSGAFFSSVAVNLPKDQLSEKYIKTIIMRINPRVDSSSKRNDLTN
mgnify:CR=1 FL=1